MSDKNTGRKLKYEAPVMIPLGTLARGLGYCSTGSGASDGYCEPGAAAAAYCTAGIAAGTACTQGGAALTAACTAGDSAVGACTAGGIV